MSSSERVEAPELDMRCPTCGTKAYHVFEPLNESGERVEIDVRERVARELHRIDCEEHPLSEGELDLSIDLWWSRCNQEMYFAQAGRILAIVRPDDLEARLAAMSDRDVIFMAENAGIWVVNVGVARTLCRAILRKLREAE